MNLEFLNFVWECQNLECQSHTTIQNYITNVLNTSFNDELCCQLFPFVLARLRPYPAESTPSRPIWEVKQQRARLVLGTEKSWESRVSLAFCLPFSVKPFFLLLFLLFFLISSSSSSFVFLFVQSISYVWRN